MNVGDWENVEDLRQEILNLLGIKHVPSKKAPHFYSHLGNKTVIRTFCITSSMNFLNVKFFQTSLYMMNIFRSITENEAGVLKANLSEPEFDGLRNDPFHFSDTNIKVSRYLPSYYYFYVVATLQILFVTNHTRSCSTYY